MAWGKRRGVGFKGSYFFWHQIFLMSLTVIVQILRREDP
jgi:hypothetical protein